jgi:hypothetical protein
VIPNWPARLSAAALTAALLTAAAACSSSTPTSHSSKAATPTHSASAADGTALTTKAQVIAALPDQHAMGAMEQLDNNVVAGPGDDCTPPAYCKATWTGQVTYNVMDPEHVGFDIATFATTQDAQAAAQQLFAQLAKESPLTEPKLGAESISYTKNSGGLDGAYITTRIGSVIATTYVEGTPTYDPALTQAAQMFTQRITQSESGQPPTATLPQE